MAGGLVVAGNMPRQIMRQQTVVVDDRPVETPFTDQAVGQMRTQCPGADQHGLSGVRCAPSRQPGSKIALELKVYLSRLHDDRPSQLPVDGGLPDLLDVADLAALILSVGSERDAQGDRDVAGGLLAHEGPQIDPLPVARRAWTRSAFRR